MRGNRDSSDGRLFGLVLPVFERSSRDWLIDAVCSESGGATYPDRALERRNKVIDAMIEDHAISSEKGAAARAAALKVAIRS